jgi:hypothetical protein
MESGIGNSLGVFGYNNSYIMDRHVDGNNRTRMQLTFQLSKAHPTANKVQTRAWGSLACVYLGLPAS